MSDRVSNQDVERAANFLTRNPRHAGHLYTAEGIASILRRLLSERSALEAEIERLKREIATEDDGTGNVDPAIEAVRKSGAKHAAQWRKDNAP